MKRIVIAFIALLFFSSSTPMYATNASISANTTSCTSPCNNLQITWDTSSPPATSITIMEIYTDTSNNVSIPSSNNSSSPTGSFTYSNLAAGSHKFRLVADGNNSSGTLDNSGWSTTVTVSAATPTNTPTPTPTTAPTSAPAPTATPTPSSGGSGGTSITRFCNESCGQSNQVCQSGLYCATIDSQGNKACRLQAYPTRSDCSVPGFTPSSSSTPTPTSTTTSGSNLSPTPSSGGSTTNFDAAPQVLGAQTTNTTKNSSQGILAAKDYNFLQNLLYPLLPSLENDPFSRALISTEIATVSILSLYFLGRFLFRRKPTVVEDNSLPIAPHE